MAFWDVSYLASHLLVLHAKHLGTFKCDPEIINERALWKKYKDGDVQDEVPQGPAQGSFLGAESTMQNVPFLVLSHHLVTAP